MTVIREIAAIAALSLPRWRRDVALALASWLVMVAVLWVPFGH
jgi:hypothetical protein